MCAATLHGTIQTCIFHWEWLLLTVKTMLDSDSTYPKTPMSNFNNSLLLEIHSKISNFE